MSFLSLQHFCFVVLFVWTYNHVGFCLVLLCAISSTSFTSKVHPECSRSLMTTPPGYLKTLLRVTSEILSIHPKIITQTATLHITTKYGTSLNCLCILLIINMNFTESIYRKSLFDTESIYRMVIINETNMMTIL